MKAFVTGGTGFIGRRLVLNLRRRGYEIVGLARSETSAASLRAASAQVVLGDVTAAESMRGGMQGADVVFHLAAWVGANGADPRVAERINVGGTRNVLCLARELGIPKSVYVSTVAVFGDTRGKVVDEGYRRRGPFFTEYDRTKWLAYRKVVLPLVEKGTPIVVVIPGGVYGPGDQGFMADLMRLFYRGLPVLAGPRTTITYAHVEDVAEGIVLAAEKGKIGESYVLAGPAVPMDAMFEMWAELTGRQAPILHIPARYVRPLAPVAGALAGILPLPPLFSPEMMGVLGRTYMARADKARSELGWKPRPLRQGMAEMREWIESE